MKGFLFIIDGGLPPISYLIIGLALVFVLCRKRVTSTKTSIVDIMDKIRSYDTPIPTKEVIDHSILFYGDVPDRVGLSEAQFITDIPAAQEGEKSKTAEQFLLEGYTEVQLSAFKKQRKMVFMGYFKKEGYKEGFAFYFFECPFCKRFSVSHLCGSGSTGRVVCCWCCTNLYPEDFLV